MPRPLVSILINNYNYGRYLAASIDSALSQTYKDVELIVVDDGSTDDSRCIVEKSYKNVIAIFKENGGQASCFNAGFERSSGDVICFLDADDVFLPDKVERVVCSLQKSPAEWCFHAVQWTDADLNLLPGPPAITYETGSYDFRAEVYRGGCNFRPPATSGLAFSRSLLRNLLPMPENIRITSDNYVKLAALGLAPGYFIADRLTLQRMHGNNLYTAKQDERQIASIQLATAISMRSNFPLLRRNCNRMFATGIVNQWKAGSTLKKSSEVIHDYLTDLPFAEKSETLARILARVVRQSFKPSRMSR